jgi:hypothetical protein
VSDRQNILFSINLFPSIIAIGDIVTVVEFGVKLKINFYDSSRGAF